MQEMQPRRVCDTIDAARQGRPWPPLPVLHAAAVLRPRGLIPLSLWSELWALLLPEQLLLLANAKAALPLRIISLERASCWVQHRPPSLAFCISNTATGSSTVLATRTRAELQVWTFALAYFTHLSSAVSVFSSNPQLFCAPSAP